MQSQLGTICTPTVVPPAGLEATGGRRPQGDRSDSVSLLHLCCSTGECLLDTTFTATPPIQQPSLYDRKGISNQALDPLLLNTASAARCRRQVGDPNNSQRSRRHNRTTSELVLKVTTMEEVHGVDVSWLHHPHKGHIHNRTQSSPDVRKNAKNPSAATVTTSPQGKLVQQTTSDLSKLPSPPNVTPPTPVEPTRDTTHAFSSAPLPSPSLNSKQAPKRPGVGSKRSSWMNSLSSKFSSQSTPERPAPIPTQPSKQYSNGLPSPAVNGAASPGSEVSEEAEPYTPSRPKESSSSFFSSIARRLSTASQTEGIPKAQGAGTICRRMVLNVDPNRERCTVPEMDESRLRRVSFCVDVEIAGGPRYREEDDDDDEARKRKKKEFKMKERAEGEALKHPEALKEEKDVEGEPKLESKSKSNSSGSKDSSDKNQDESGAPLTEEDKDAAARKKEKKQRSEAERKERKEKRRRRAEENGQIPVEVMLDGDGQDAADGSTPSAPTQPQKNGIPIDQTPKTPQQPQPNAGRQDRPTTDPARIYRRCCQLRESPILKRITEQLSNPKCILPQEPGVVNCLDLTGSRLQLADVISLGDWLAVVPVKHLKMEDADLSDEGVRCVLAGLLAAKRPAPTKRKSTTPKHRQGITIEHHQERAGVVERLTLKNNPRLTRIAWKHISLFIYMCRSLKAIDLSMNQFPDTLPPSAHVTPIKSPQNAPSGRGQETDAAECLFKCLSERLGGSRLEELILSECGLTAAQIRKAVDGAMACGISRLGLAGNHIEDDGLGYVIRYLRSGVCQAMDLGGNDLRGKLGLLADAINNRRNLPCWGLSLAGCNLDGASLKPLFAAIQRLPNFRFIDLSHNRDLCNADSGFISLLRRYIPQMKDLKRIHLADVGMSPKQAIALADVLPDGPRLAHLDLRQNPQLTALANAKTESDQEEACALYASLMASVRVSNTLICIDIDVPSAENSEVVKALAKQVVAYSLRNMEQFAIAEATGIAFSTENATTKLTSPYGGEKGVKEMTVPDVLMHLVGHVEGTSQNADNDGPAPDEDYIVGGTGVVRALQYVLGEKANDNRRDSTPLTPTTNTPSGATPTGVATPKDRQSSTAGLEPGKAKKMSKNLLGSARKIRDRLQPALLKEASAGDELAYRRLLFLDQTLQSMIERFEEEYPETRIVPSSPKRLASESSSLTDQSNLLASSVNTQGSELTQILSQEDEDMFDADEGEVRPTVSRHNSDVNIASRALSMEEGRLHRMGQQLRREVIDSPRSAEPGADGAPWRQQQAQDEENERLRRIGERIEGISGVELRTIVDKEGWDSVLQKLGATYDDLRSLQEQDPEGWEAFKDAQLKARLNLDMERPSSRGNTATNR